MDLYVPLAGRSVRPPDLHSPPRDGAHERDTRPTPPEPEQAEPQPATAWRRYAELPMLVGAALVLAFVIKTFLLQAFYIPSESMVPALQVGDRVLVEKVSYRLREPARGEVAVFRRPGVDGAEGIGESLRSFLAALGLVQPDTDVDVIKRIVGLPGEKVVVRRGTVVVDGRALAEPSVIPETRSFPPVTVPDDSYYVLGDNRTNSDDSRYSLGAVPRELIVGRAFMIVWPPGNVSVSLRKHYAGEALDLSARADPLSPVDSPAHRSLPPIAFTRHRRHPSRRLYRHEPHRPRRHRQHA